MNIKTVLPPKKIVWKSFASIIDLSVWMFIFGALNFKDIKTLGIFAGLFVWTFVDYYIGHRLGEKEKE